MKKGKLTKVLSAALAVAMLAAMGGCNNGGSAGTDTGAAGQDAGSASQEAASQGSDSAAADGGQAAPVSSLADIEINEAGTDATGHEGETAPEGIQAGTHFTYWSNYDIPIYTVLPDLF